MKNFIASIFLGIFMLFGVVTIANATSTAPAHIDISKLQVVYLNDVLKPSVAPQYGKAHFVHTNSDKVSGYISAITPNANSPPTGITGE